MVSNDEIQGLADWPAQTGLGGSFQQVLDCEAPGDGADCVVELCPKRFDDGILQPAGQVDPVVLQTREAYGDDVGDLQQSRGTAETVAAMRATRAIEDSFPG